MVPAAFNAHSTPSGEIPGGTADPIGRELAQQIGSAAAPIALFDLELRYLALSSAWRSEYGLGDSELLGRSHYEIFPDIPQRWRDLNERALAGEYLSSDLDLFARADGEVRWLRWSMRPWRTLGGAIGGVVMATEGVSEFNRLRTEIDAVRADFDGLFENAAATVAIVEWDGRIARASSSFAALLDADPQCLAGAALLNAIAARVDDRESVASVLETGLSRIRNGSTRAADVRIRFTRAEGGARWLHCTVTRIGTSDATVPRLAVFLRDETERVEMERRMRDSDRIASIGMLGAGLGHDLQNVLLPMRAHLNALGTEFADDEAGRRCALHLESIQGCVAYLRQLADSMHFLASAESDGQAADAASRARVPTEIQPWLETIEPLLMAAVPRGIRFERLVAPGCAPVALDSGVLTQVVLNLVVNARDAIVQRHGAESFRGELRVAFDTVLTNRKRAVRLVVTDNGIGMDKGVCARACEPYFTTKPTGRGTGLGLAMVAKSVEGAGGHISIASTMGSGTTGSDTTGSGTTVEIRVPAARRPARPRA